MSGFWVIGLNIAVRSMISKRVRSEHLRGRLQQQKIANLPRDRMNEEAPFTFCSVDIFGPFVVKNGRKELKQYGALYTCLSGRTIQIEVTYSLNTDSLMCLRRFIGQRGNLRLLRSDNGSNFTGASAGLIQAFQEIDHSRISNYLEEHGGEWINWKRNPPFASNMGGGVGNNRFRVLQ